METVGYIPEKNEDKDRGNKPQGDSNTAIGDSGKDSGAK